MLAVGLMYGSHEIMHGKHFTQSLAHERCSVRIKSVGHSVVKKDFNTLLFFSEQELKGEQ